MNPAICPNNCISLKVKGTKTTFIPLELSERLPVADVNDFNFLCMNPAMSQENPEFSELKKIKRTFSDS
jgi:hypothetical protein